ncbi:MAG: hemolysin family protein [Spirochaetes bacterium]|nr:hemolysin family protein [Spirochaetota bacterium]
MEDIIYQILIGIFIVLSFFFSGIETAIISSDSIKIRALAEKGSRRAKKSLYIIDNIEDALGMVLIGNNIANVSATSFIVFIATKAFYLKEAEIVAVTAVQTMFFLVFCEILPKTIARSRSEVYLNLLSYPIFFLMIIFRPAVRLSLLFSKKMKTVFHLKSARYSAIGSRDEIGTLFRMGEKEGIIDRDHHNFVSEILSFHEVTANEVMTPAIDIKSIEKNGKIKDLVRLIGDTRFSRIPVYEGRVDNIIGYVHYRDIITKKNVRKAADIIEKPYYVPATKKISELYIEMHDRKIPMVFVVNEFGGVIGLLTIEDIAEEIVGEIHTRDHPKEELIKKISKSRYLLSGYLDIDYLKKHFNIHIDKKGFETISGFVSYKLGRIPEKGDRFDYGGYSFTVNEATDRSVLKVMFARKSTRSGRKRGEGE